jgi:hypothetical protein
VFLRFDERVKYDASAESLLAYMRLCVERSKSLDRTLRVVNALVDDDSDDWEHYPKVLGYLQSQSNWAGLHIDWRYYTDFINKVLYKKDDHYDWDHSYFPTLRSLTLHRHHSEDDIFDDPDEPIFAYGTHLLASRFPLLRQLDIDLDLHTMDYNT